MTRVLITAIDHRLYDHVVTITHTATIDGAPVWVVETDAGVRDYVREGQFKVVKQQDDAA